MSKNLPTVKFCQECVYPSSSAVPLEFDENGVCSGCNTAKERYEIDWGRRREALKQILDEYKNPDGYDCIIPVSGGKDSYFQTHLIKNEFGMNPLLVTYNSNNYTEVGLRNLHRMREAFGVDHIFYTPSIHTLIKLNRLCFKLMGDMNWHGHAGIFTYPIREAVAKRTPLMIWGEHGFADLGGMHSYSDLVEFTFRYRHEHCLRGYEWYDMTDKALIDAGHYGLCEGLKDHELISWKYPSDAEIEEVGVRGIYISNFIKWEASSHSEMMMNEYGFEPYPEDFDRTYKRLSNLDDMHENGVHDYLKFIKFGYGRASDHCSKDIRDGKLTRDSAIKIVNRMDPKKPSDLYRWLEYVEMSEAEFDYISDTFRDPRVWWIKDSEWWKHTIDGEPRSFGPVFLPKNEQGKYQNYV